MGLTEHCSLEASIDAVRDAMNSSQMLKDVAEVRKMFEFTDNGKYRKLIGAEKWQMEQQGVRAEDWDKVLVSPSFDSSRIQNCTLQGNIRLGDFSGHIHLKRRAIKLPSGVYNCDLKNVIVDDGAYVSRTSLLHNVFVGASACVMGCGEVTCSGSTAFGNGQALPLGIETGGRDTRIFAEMTVPVAAAVATCRSHKEVLAKYDQAVAEYTAKATSPATIVGPGSRVMHTPIVTDVYMGRGAIIDSAVRVEDTTMLSTLEECAMVLAGCSAKGTLMQWGSMLQGISLVDHGLLCEYSTVCHHGKVADSVVGPNSYVAEGECTATLCGPFVRLDHQALLIACLWPGGKGTVGYGANVGSNHTSKAPDQELWSGEGLHYGLGCCIKYPTDFSRAPYSVVDSGAICLPQRMTLPFSLISSPAHNITGISPAFNELRPGWVLEHNLEGVSRAESCWKRTNRARRQEFVFDVLRPDTVDEVVKAREVLRVAKGRGLLATEQGEMVFTERQIAGVGKNYVVESARVAAIDTYTFYIQYYGLQGLYDQLQAGADPDQVLCPTSPGEGRGWAHRQSVLNMELPDVSVVAMLDMFVEMQARIRHSVLGAKHEDAVVGRAIIRDYEVAREAVGGDPFVAEFDTRTERLTASVRELIHQLS